MMNTNEELMVDQIIAMPEAFMGQHERTKNVCKGWIKILVVQIRDQAQTVL